MRARRTFLKRALGTFAGLGVLGVSTSSAVQKPAKANFLHIVFIWLKDPDKYLKNVMAATEEFVKEVPSVKSFHIGVPASTNRPIVDNSYSFCLTVGFDDLEGHDLYQEHEAHKKYVSETKNLWTKVQVYDSTR